MSSGVTRLGWQLDTASGIVRPTASAAQQAQPRIPADVDEGMGSSHFTFFARIYTFSCLSHLGALLLQRVTQIAAHLVQQPITVEIKK
jgi:hypothetical protein